MNGKKTIEYVEKLRTEKGISYLDIRLYKGYQELFRYGYSTTGTPTGNERLYMFSMTKPMTVACAMRLVEEGKLSLDEEVATYLPAYADTFLLDEQGNKVPTKTKMTVRHLLTMSGGLTYNMQTEPILEALKTPEKVNTVSFVNTFIQTPLSFEPGERFQYSLCHDTLAAVVEKVTGKKFSAYMSEVIFQPLGMQNSGFFDKNQDIYDLYWSYPMGIQQVEPQNHYIVSKDYDSGGAGLITDVEDYGKFAVVLANDGVSENGYRLLKKETIDDICKSHYRDIYVNCAQDGEYDYGLGVRVRNRETEWGLPKGEFGWDGAAASYVMIDRVHKIAVVIGMHLREWPNIFKGEHTNIVEQLYRDMQEEGLW